MHPILSIVTGELKCRGIYIDENGLDVQRHRVESYPLQREDFSALGLCDAVKRNGSQSSVECIRHRAAEDVVFDVVKISPSIGPVVDVPEAIVLVVHDGSVQLQNNRDWYASDLNASILHLIKKLGSKKDCPWLAKTVFVVSPVIVNVGNATTTDDSPSSPSNLVEAFLSSYSGQQTKESMFNINPLPPHYTYPMLRSLLVLASIPTNDQYTEVRILPHGKDGALPNLDLVFATVLSFQSRDMSGGTARSVFYDSESEFRVHPFKDVEKAVIHGMDWFWNLISGEELEKLLGMEENSIKKPLMQYAKDMGGWIGFVSALILGREGAHSPALERGIDSLTVELRVKTSLDGMIHKHYGDAVRVTEHLLRSMSNLHERLHHSVAQYTMPSVSKFVSHGEYIFPAILVSLPLVVRAAMLALRDVKRFRFRFVGVVMGVVALVSVCLGVWSDYQNKKTEVQHDTSIDLIAVTVYLFAHFVVLVASSLAYMKEVQKDVWKAASSWISGSQEINTVRREIDLETTMDDHHNSLSFIACISAIYLHVPLLLANYSLGIASSAFWTPLLAILTFLPSRHRGRHKGLLLAGCFTKLFVIHAICPPVYLVPRMFGSYTTYVKVVYTPLSLLLLALWLSIV